jgi:translation initiation factor IF-2
MALRVYDIAKELGIDTKDALAKLEQLGEYVKSGSSTIAPPVVKKLRDAFPNAKPKEEPKAAPAKPVAEKVEAPAAPAAEKVEPAAPAAPAPAALSNSGSVFSNTAAFKPPANIWPAFLPPVCG